MYENKHKLALNNIIQESTHILWEIERIFVSLQKYKYRGHTSSKTILFVLQREYCAPDTWTCFEDIDNHFYQAIEKSLYARKVSQNLFRLNKAHSQRGKNAFVIPTNKGRCATHLKCSQLFRPCLQCLHPFLWRW